jgi:DNA-binding transcriptional LysR family regulator
LEIHHLKAFVAVARTGHLTRAAEQLHLSQPAVSKQLRALEDCLGLTLFDRLPTGMQLTRAGRELLGSAESTLRQADQLLDQAQRWRGGVAGSMQLGTIIDPEYLRLGPLLGKLLVNYPLIDVKLQHGISGWVLEQVASGQLDAGFCLGAAGGPGLAHVQIAEPIYLIVGPTAWQERIAAAGWAELAAMPWIGTPRRSSQHWLTAQLARHGGHALNYVVEADQESSMVNLMRTGVGLCLMREDLALAAAARNELVPWAGVRLPCPLNFIYPAARVDDSVMAALLRTLRDVWAADATVDGDNRAGWAGTSNSLPPRQ